MAVAAGAGAVAVVVIAVVLVGTMTMNYIVFEYIKVNLNCFASILLYTHKTCSIALLYLLSSARLPPAHARTHAHAHSLSVYRLRRVKRVSRFRCDNHFSGKAYLCYDSKC